MNEITPNKLGHQPKPFTTTRDGRREDDDRNLEKASDTPKLQALKDALSEAQSDASDYFRRVQNATDWLNSRWEGQTKDGLKWHSVGPAIDSVWPWEGASDTRTHIISKVAMQHEVVLSFALRNMKIQAKSSRPFANMSQSQQGSTLLNWMISTHMQMEAHRETRLAGNWRNIFGASVIATDWRQERRIDYVPVSLMTLSALTESQGMAGQGGMLSELQGTDMTQWQAIIADESNEEALVPFIQRFSPILTKAQARKVIRELRELKVTEIPIPYVFISQPRWRAMRPMIDIFFPADADELNQNPRWTAEPEDLTETELTDRIETANYDPGFVRDALEHKGDDSQGPWTERQLTDWNGRKIDFDNKVRIWHFKYKALDRGTPVLFDTVFHMNVDREALHGPCQYQHGEYGYHDMRFERRAREILSSKGIAEYAYTWQQEIKKQRDGRTDRVDLTLRPPMHAPYRDVLKMKTQFAPGIIYPSTRANEIGFMQPPQYDPGSVEIERTIMQAIDQHFGLFGESVDPILKQQRTAQFAEDFLMEMKPVIKQTFQLMQQYLPDELVESVAGPLSRPFKVSRQEIQGQHEITLTVDTKDMDREALDTMLNIAVQTTSLDTTGVIDRSKLVKFIMEKISPDFAAEVVQDEEPATEKEIKDERQAVSRIIGSGLDEDLPMGANYQLRMQTLQARVQEAQQNEATTQILQNNPAIMKVLMNRMQFFQRQIGQMENAKIGRMQVTKTFSKQAPQMALPVQ